MSRQQGMMDFPPITVVTTSGTGSVGSRGSRKPKKTTPSILIKKKENTTAPNAILQQPLSVPTNNIPVGSAAIVDSSSLNVSGNVDVKEVNDNEVDSALLSALRDKRERMALLRLEKNLIDFMNDKNCGYMDVGGSGNSVVIKGVSNLDSGSASLNGENDSATPLVTTGTRTNMGTDPTMNAGRQTSFQRLCLHRLADRFGIVREQAYASPINNNGVNLASIQQQQLGLIRLIKTSDSRIPSTKLINLDLSQYDENIPQDRNGDSSVAVITDRLSNSNLQDSGHGSSTGKRSKKKDRVKIMKRSSTGSLGGNKEKNSKSNNSKRKGKKLSDKEKAYAEARARIFASEAKDANANSSPDNSEHTDNDFKGVSVNTGVTGDASDEKETPTSQDPLNGSQHQRGHFPAAVAGGAASKVTWRNRDQEAADPDFQRRHHPSMLQQMPMHYHTSYGAQPAHYPYQSSNNASDTQRNQTFFDGTSIPSTWNGQEFIPRGFENYNSSQTEESVDSSNVSKVKAQEVDLSKEEFPALR